MSDKLEELRMFFEEWKAKDPQAIEATLKHIPKEIRDKFDDFTVFTSLNIMSLRQRGEIK